MKNKIAKPPEKKTITLRVSERDLDNAESLAKSLRFQDGMELDRNDILRAAIGLGITELGKIHNIFVKVDQKLKVKLPSKVRGL